MLTRLRLKRGEGNLVGRGYQIGTRTRRAHLPQSPPQVSPKVVPKALVSMSHEGGLDNILKDETSFKKEFLDMTHMVKVHYEERNSRLKGESSKPSKGKNSSGGKGGDDDKLSKGNCDEPPSSSPPSSSKTTLTQEASVERPSEKEDGQVCTFCPHHDEDEVLSTPKSKEMK